MKQKLENLKKLLRELVTENELKIEISVDTYYTEVWGIKKIDNENLEMGLDLLGGNRHCEIMSIDKFIELAQNRLINADIDFIKILEDVLEKGGSYAHLDYRWVENKEKNDVWKLVEAIAYGIFGGDPEEIRGGELEYLEITKRVLLKKSLIDNKKAYADRLEIISVDTRVKSLKDIYDGKYGEKEIIDLNPNYQRNLVWTLDQKQSYIMNLFKGIAKIEPTIVEYYKRNSNIKVWEILDGKQRLTTIFDYIDGKFPLNVDGQYAYYNDLLEVDKNFLYKHGVKYTRVMSHDYLEPLKKDKLSLFIEKNLLGTKMDDVHLEMINRELKELNK